MAKFGNRVRLAWLKGMEALGTSASNLASNAKFRVAELNMESRRREILTEFNLKAFELWQKGEKLPPALDEMFQELSELDGKLNDLRAQRYAALNGNVEDAVAAPDGEASEPAEAQPAEAVPALADAPAEAEPDAPEADESTAEEPPQA